MNQSNFHKTLEDVLHSCPAFVRGYCDAEFAENGVAGYKGWILRAALHCQKLSASGFALPEAFLKRYPHSFEELRQSGVPAKYRLRGNNTMRELVRTKTFLPELIHATDKRSILDLSSGPCGVHEVLRYYGHEVTSSDCFDKDAPPYRLIYDALDVNPVWFDGATLPLPFETKSVDIVTCHQAINWYASYLNWEAHLAEFRRIGRDKVVVIFNTRQQVNQPVVEYIAAYCARYPDSRGALCPDTRLPVLVIDIRD